MKIIIASNNTFKLKEMRAILSPFFDDTVTGENITVTGATCLGTNGEMIGRKVLNA